ncbi:MAG: transglutaminase domain-containing protein [Arenicella sp.]|nr:transglutaminase domain-containing protein [Arenicella sp.]HAU68002.1 transglutaminase domain-containing protein [Gammaproteobacteria bacterium]
MQNAAWQDTATQELLEKAENASNSPLTPDALNEQLRREQKRAQRGKMSSLYSQQSLSQRELDKNYSTTPANQRFYSYVWNDSYGDLLALTAIGLDGQPYFANSFLMGFVPFELDNAWQPLALISMRKTYMFDHDQYGAQYEDVWQNSKQAYVHSHGDCEDHALLLADWLIGLGYDARVAVGETPEGGHAWVVLFLDSQTYILEATSKRAPKSINDFLLASRAITYYPEIQFNRTQIWENTGSVLTTNYNDKKWVERAEFIRNKP